MTTALAYCGRLRYNEAVNVPAARMVAERPAFAIWRCGRPTGPDSNARLHASPKIGPQVSFNFSSLVEPALRFKWFHKRFPLVCESLPKDTQNYVEFVDMVGWDLAFQVAHHGVAT